MNDTIESLLSNYRKFAHEHGAATERGDAKSANKNHDLLLKTYSIVIIYGDEGKAALRDLMHDRSASVATWAASQSLQFIESEALGVLDNLAQGRGILAFNAAMVAQQWRTKN